MTDDWRGVLCIGLAVGCLAMLVWQWRSGENADGHLANLAEDVPKLKRPFLWLTTLFYGLLALALFYGGVWFITGAD
jgi:cyanate permease